MNANAAPPYAADLDALRRLADAGAQYVLIPHRSKIPTGERWQHQRHDWTAIEAHLRRGGNAGLLLIAGWTDVDLDSDEAIALAPDFLPATGCTFGRDSARQSHWIFRCEPGATYAKYVDPLEADRERAAILELRAARPGAGLQTVIPGSTHPSGEPITFDDDGVPAGVNGEELMQCAADLAAATLLGLHWPQKGARHDSALALAGFLLRGGLDAIRTARIVCGAARVAGDEEWRERRHDVDSTAAGLRAGRSVTGAPTLAELVGVKIVDKLRDWLDLGWAGSSSSNGAAAADTESAADAWGALVPLDHAREIPALPLEALSPWLREITSALTHAYQVPPELPGMYALALVSGAMAGRYVVVVRTGWRMPPVLYVVVALPPSERKSPVIHRLAEPLRAWEREQAVAIADARRQALVAVEQARARAEAALRAIARPPKDADSDALAEAHRAAAQKLAEAETAVPAEARLIVEYATPEALAERMADRGDRQIILSDEGAGVLAMTGRYARWGGADLDLLLRGADGLPYTPARITRTARPMTAATLTIALGAQPAAIVDLLRHAPEIRERGLLARMLALVPAPRVGARQIRPAPVPVTVSAEYDRRMRALLDVPDVFVDGRLVPREMRLASEADDVIAAFEERLEPELGRGGRHERIAAAAGKLAGTAARIAAVLHAADYAGAAIPAEIPAATAERAVRLAEACIPHAEALEDALAAPPELDGARRIADWLRRHGESVVSDRDILRGTRGAAILATAEQRDAALRLLERHGYIRRPDAARPRSTGRPTRGWEVRPDWLTSRNTDRDPHGRNGQNPRGVQESAGIVHSVHEVGTVTTDDAEVIA